MERHNVPDDEHDGEVEHQSHQAQWSPFPDEDDGEIEQSQWSPFPDEDDEEIELPPQSQWSPFPDEEEGETAGHPTQLTPSSFADEEEGERAGHPTQWPSSSFADEEEDEAAMYPAQWQSSPGEGQGETEEEAEAGKILLSRAELKNLIQQEVLTSLLSRDRLKNEDATSHLDTTKAKNEDQAGAIRGTSRSFSDHRDNNTVNTSSGNGDLLEQGRMETMVETTTIESILAENKYLTQRLHSVEEDLGVIERKFEDQGHQIRTEMSSFLRIADNHSLAESMRTRSATTIFNRNFYDNIPHDTFSLMSVSTPLRRPWRVCVATYIFQMTLCVLIAFNQIKMGNESSIFDVPIQVSPGVRAAQLMSILFAVSTQSDVLTSIQTLTLLWKSTRWDQPVLGRDEHSEPPTTAEWLVQILLPNLMKLSQGLAVIFVSFVVIVQSSNIIDLLKDFTALMIVSELDNLVFELAVTGYVGRQAQVEAAKVKDIKLLYTPNYPISLGDVKKCNGFVLRPTYLIAIVSTMVGGWLYITLQQANGTIFRARYPDCKGVDHIFAKQHFDDGECYGGPLNTLGCEFEGGDCINFNLEYPLCRGDDKVNAEKELKNKDCNMIFATAGCAFDDNACCPLVLTNHSTFGDGICNYDIGYGSNTLACQYEGGDCLQYNDKYCDVDGTNFTCCPLAAVNDETFGNAICNGGISSTAICDYDNKDCNEFHNAHPECPLDDLAKLEESKDVILGDGVCDNGLYSIEKCGWEYGDCAVGQVGQDLRDFRSILNNKFIHMSSKISIDGNVLVVGMPLTDDEGKFIGFVDGKSPGRIKIFQYHSSKKIWIQLEIDVQGDSGGDRFGHSIAMNRIGSRIVIGAPGNSNRRSEDQGYVKVFDITTTRSGALPIQVGQTLRAEESTSGAGYNIDLASDSSILAISSPYSNRGGSDAGQIQIFQLQKNNTTSSDPQGKEWVLVGDILGKSEYEHIGIYSLHLSAYSGKRVIFSVGSLPSLSSMASPSTAIRVYADSTNSNDWAQIGEDIPTPYLPNDYTSSSVAISGYGSRIVIASNVTSDVPGEVQILDYNAGTEKYDQIGDKIKKSPYHDRDGFGRSIALSNDGNLLAISSGRSNCDDRSDLCATGAVELFVYDRIFKRFRKLISNPKLRKDNIIKEERNSFRDSSVFGIHLSLAKNAGSNDGNTWLSVQSYNIDTNEGYVTVYNLDEQFYPRCVVEEPSYIGNGICTDKPPYNSEACGFDGGDCESKPANLDLYPGCLVHDPSRLENKFCDDWPPYNSEACGFDNGYCIPKEVDNKPDCLVHDPSLIGDGICDFWPPYNTDACDSDGGDCNEIKPHENYPKCYVLKQTYIRDDHCDDYRPYNTEACGWDGGDCPPFR